MLVFTGNFCVTAEHQIQFFFFFFHFSSHLEEGVNEFQPDIIFYNAGTDCLKGDPLGALSVSPQVSEVVLYVVFQ